MWSVEPILAPSFSTLPSSSPAKSSGAASSSAKRAAPRISLGRRHIERRFKDPVFSSRTGAHPGRPRLGAAF